MAEDAEGRHVLAAVGAALAAGGAITAGEVGVDHDAVTGLEMAHVGPGFRDGRDVFVAQDRAGRSGVAGGRRENVQVGAANAGAVDLQ